MLMKLTVDRKEGTEKHAPGQTLYVWFGVFVSRSPFSSESQFNEKTRIQKLLS